MKYAVEMGSGGMIYIPSLIMIYSGIQKLIGGHSQTHRQHGDFIILLLFSQNKESRLIIGRERASSLLFQCVVSVSTDDNLILCKGNGLQLIICVYYL
jgi:hypothetical protein